MRIIWVATLALLALAGSSSPQQIAEILGKVIDGASGAMVRVWRINGITFDPSETDQYGKVVVENGQADMYRLVATSKYPHALRIVVLVASKTRSFTTKLQRQPSPGAGAYEVRYKRLAEVATLIRPS